MKTNEYSHVMARVAYRVRYLRKQLKLSRRELSELTNISQRYLAQLEAGQANISIVLLDKVSTVLDTTIDTLVKPS